MSEERTTQTFRRAISRCASLGFDTMTQLVGEYFAEQHDAIHTPHTLDWQPAEPLPTLPGWYEVRADHLTERSVRASGRDGRWWTALGKGNGDDGWMTSPDGYEWRGPLADVDADPPVLTP